MNFGQAIATCMRKYVTFSGRAKRSEFWWFNFFFCLISLLLVSLIYLLIIVIIASVSSLAPGSGSGIEMETIETIETIAIPGTIVFFIIWLALLIPLFAVGSRRLHDIGRSGWWQLLGPVPYIGILFYIILIIWWATDSKPEGDKYDEPVSDV